MKGGEKIKRSTERIKLKLCYDDVKCFRKMTSAEIVCQASLALA